jgi:hypothetical protein
MLWKNFNNGWEKSDIKSGGFGGPLTHMMGTSSRETARAETLRWTSWRGKQKDQCGEVGRWWAE